MVIHNVEHLINSQPFWTIKCSQAKKQNIFVCLGHENVVSLLLKKNAKAGELDKELRTPLHIAAKNGNFSEKYWPSQILEIVFF